MKKLEGKTGNKFAICQKCRSKYSKSDLENGAFLPFGWDNNFHPDARHSCFENASDFELMTIAAIIPCIYEAGSEVGSDQKVQEALFGRFFTKSCRSERPEGFWKL